MAIDIFREGISQYLTEVEKRRREEAAGKLNDIAQSLCSGPANPEEIKTLTLDVAGNLIKGTSTIETIKKEVDGFTKMLARKFEAVGIDLPPAEILTQPVQQDKDRQRREAIRSFLGDSGAFLIPVAPGETGDPLEQKIEVLKLPVKPYNGLKRSGRSTIGQVLDTSLDDFQRGKVRNFGQRCLEDTIEALDRYGILAGPLVPENPIVVEAQGPNDSPLD